LVEKTGLGHITVSFANLSAPYGRINRELIVFDLPLFISPFGRKNRVRA